MMFKRLLLNGRFTEWQADCALNPAASVEAVDTFRRLAK
jgi:hypothetical protein